MKALLWQVVFCLAVGTALAQDGAAAAPGQGAVITWEQNSYDFGDIQQGEKVEYTFRFSNTGTEPLIITNITTQCGCTTPKGWPRDPILPGGKGEITLAFNSAGKYGRQNKVATIVSNAVNVGGRQLILSGTVVQKKPQ
ncbi:MAG: DUF1573 domain-containing protein [Bacteroidota bacterium]